jgi:vancomycin resistance protein YoaR
MIDRKAFDQQLSLLLADQSTHDLQIPTSPEVPTVNSQDLKNSQSDLEVKLDNEIALHYQSQKWQFKPKNHLEDITFDKLNSQIVIKVSPSLIEGFFQKEIFDKFEIPVGNLKITQDKDGKINFDGHAKDGLLVNRQQFIKDLELALNSLDSDIDIATQVVKTNVEISPELQAMGIKELISTGHTAFANSHENRRHNISVGMARFNGLIIKPNETFSFDDNLGPVDASTGYRLELVIKAEGTVPDYGGGLCQVSSTAFKAALFAGLPIVERAPHSYAVSYYAQVDGYGLDATIYPGVRDLKFINDTGNDILIQSFTDGDQAYFNFFGTSDGRQVRLENYWRGNYRPAGGTQLIPTGTLPTGVKKQIESANGGFDASWDRVITKNGQETRDKIYSVYRATANRILVGQ